ncbi:unnamed protein product [Rangifer tarandus platyrhynchus]|uniref:Uncharacterized protein n=1 Tax=Rangifer tarandus platyrhynchus TaxID=3082113 RepID=A0ABN9A1S5_RANTA|nr:unnamed protein product [Rangifer tarandus platyrhynchus]
MKWSRRAVPTHSQLPSHSCSHAKIAAFRKPSLASQATSILCSQPGVFLKLTSLALEGETHWRIQDENHSLPLSKRLLHSEEPAADPRPGGETGALHAGAEGQKRQALIEILEHSLHASRFLWSQTEPEVHRRRSALFQGTDVQHRVTHTGSVPWQTVPGCSGLWVKS